MTTGIPTEVTENAERFYTMVKSLNNFDKVEVKCVIDTLLSRTPDENCFVGTYYRTICNIDSVLVCQHPKHIQAIAMLARGLFELAVDMRLLEIIADAPPKMIAYIEVEKLRCARKAVSFKNSNPNADVDTTEYAAFIKYNGDRVDGIARSLWPNVPRLHHWSGLPLKDRVGLLKSPFNQLYAIDYPRLSWYTHPGLTGIANLQPETFTYMCSYAFKLAVDAYSEVLQVTIRKFNIAKTNIKIQEKLKVAVMLPFTDSPEHAAVLTRSIQ